jgi:nucleoside diphosphate kinase
LSRILHMELQLYEEHRGLPHFERLVAHMSSGPIWAYWLRDNCRASSSPCFQQWRSLCGPTDPFEAKRTAPDSLRAKYGTELPCNAVHGSDSVLIAHRELTLFFGDGGFVAQRIVPCIP